MKGKIDPVNVDSYNAGYLQALKDIETAMKKAKEEICSLTRKS